MNGYEVDALDHEGEKQSKVYVTLEEAEHEAAAFAAAGKPVDIWRIVCGKRWYLVDSAEVLDAYAGFVNDEKVEAALEEALPW